MSDLLQVPLTSVVERSPVNEQENLNRQQPSESSVPSTENLPEKARVLVEKWKEKIVSGRETIKAGWRRLQDRKSRWEDANKSEELHEIDNKNQEAKVGFNKQIPTDHQIQQLTSDIKGLESVYEAEERLDKITSLLNMFGNSLSPNSLKAVKDAAVKLAPFKDLRGTDRARKALSILKSITGQNDVFLTDFIDEAIQGATAQIQARIDSRLKELPNDADVGIVQHLASSVYQEVIQSAVDIPLEQIPQNILRLKSACAAAEDTYARLSDYQQKSQQIDNAIAQAKLFREKSSGALNQRLTAQKLQEGKFVLQEQRESFLKQVIEREIKKTAEEAQRVKKDASEAIAEDLHIGNPHTTMTQEYFRHWMTSDFARELRENTEVTSEVDNGIKEYANQYGVYDHGVRYHDSAGLFGHANQLDNMQALDGENKRFPKDETILTHATPLNAFKDILKSRLLASRKVQQKKFGKAQFLMDNPYVPEGLKKSKDEEQWQICFAKDQIVSRYGNVTFIFPERYMLSQYPFFEQDGLHLFSPNWQDGFAADLDSVPFLIVADEQMQDILDLHFQEDDTLSAPDQQRWIKDRLIFLDKNDSSSTKQVGIGDYETTEYDFSPGSHLSKIIWDKFRSLYDGKVDIDRGSFMPLGEWAYGIRNSKHWLYKYFIQE